MTQRQVTWRAYRLGIVLLLLAALALAGLPARVARAQTNITNCAPDQVAGIGAQLETGGHYIFSGACAGATLDFTAFGTIDTGNGITTTIEGNGVTLLNTSARLFVIASGGALLLDDVTVTGGGSGGGIENRGMLTIANSTFSSNRSSGPGGAIHNNGSDGGDATLAITNSTFASNHAASTREASGEGGAIFNDATGAGNVTVTIAGSTFLDNTIGSGSGGAILTEVEGGSASMTIATSLFRFNIALGAGGAVYNVSSDGGTSTVTIDRSTFDRNEGPNAGAIFNGTFESGSAILTVTNSTFDRNAAGITAGAINNTSLGGTARLVIASSTFSRNTNHPVNPGAIANTNPGAQAEITNTIFFDNTGSCRSVGAVFTSSGYNLLDDAGCFTTASTDRVNIAFTLPALADNGGPTPTVLLPADSPAIDTGSCLNPFTDPDSTFTIDQRGFPRPHDVAGVPNTADGCDVGAVEYQGIGADAFELRSSSLAPYPGVTRWQAGDPLYLRFSLNEGTDIADLTAIQVQPISCSSGAPSGSAATAQLVGGIRYFEGADYYQLIWRTQASWANTCKQLVLTFSDSTTARFNVQFTRNR